MAKNVKQKPLISKVCTHCFAPTHLKFNFSFITYDENFDDEYQIQFLKRIRELSSVPYLEMMNWNRKIGIEVERVSINKQISPAFFDGNSHRNFDSGKFAIFRLYPNDNPILGRVIGCLINKIFYVFFIDIGGKLYNHGS